MNLSHSVVVTCFSSAHAESVAKLMNSTKEQILREASGGYAYVAVYKEKVIGAVLLSPANESGCAIAKGVCVNPEFRGEGIGALLVQTAERRAGEAGVRRLQVASELGNVEFFYKLGYSTDGLAKSIA